MLEAEVEDHNKKLFEAVDKGQSNTIVECSKIIKDKQREIELLFNDLEETSNSVENIKAEFQEKFDLVAHWPGVA